MSGSSGMPDVDIQCGPDGVAIFDMLHRQADNGRG
jgi:hypothetical protein